MSEPSKIGHILTKRCLIENHQNLKIFYRICSPKLISNTIGKIDEIFGLKIGFEN